MLPPKVRRIATLLTRLPGVGEKTANRYVLHLLAQDPEIARELGRELGKLHDTVGPCERCGNLAESEDDDSFHPSDAPPDAPSATRICAICSDARRETKLLCVVGRVHDLFAIERSGTMRGRYFVLGKLLSPLEGVGPDDLPIPRLVRRVIEEGVTEIIVATPPSVDGEATALFLKRELGALGVALSRIASGVPHGGDLEYADPITMGRALSGRLKL